MKLFQYNLGIGYPLETKPFTLTLTLPTIDISDAHNSTKKIHINQNLRRCLIDVIDNSNYHYRLLLDEEGFMWIKVYILRDFMENIIGHSCPTTLLTIGLICGRNYFSNYSIAGTDSEITEDSIQLQTITTHRTANLTANLTMKLKIKPYDHQISNVDWMINIENMVAQNRFYLEYVSRSKLLSMKLKDGLFYLDPDTYSFYTESGLWNSHMYTKIPLKGGILADEVGLGKTLSIVLLVIASKYAGAPHKVQKVSVKVRVKNDSDDIKKTLPTLGAAVESSGKPNGGTLIVCPRRLVGQWMQEISKYTNALNVLEVSSMTHINKYSIAQISSADIVIVPSTMFSNATYIENPKQLSHIMWTRLVVDEGHEFMACEGKKRIETTRIDSGIFVIPSKYRWSCTGTPFPHGRSSLNGIISYLSSNGHNYISPYLSNVSEYNTFLNLVCRRNTHESTKEQIKIPPYQEHIISVDFTNTERAIYDSTPDTDIKLKRQLCTNINVSNLSNLSDGGILDLNQMNKVLAQRYQDDIYALEQDTIDTQIKIEGLKTHETDNLNDIIDRIKVLESLTITNTNTSTRETTDELKMQRESRDKLRASIKSRIKSAEDRIISNNDKIAKAQEKMQLFRSLDHQSIANYECPILGVKLTKKFVITREGQYYSYDGLSMLFIGRDVVTCPITKKEIIKGSFLVIDPQTSSQEAENVSIDRIKWGSKLAKVMETLKQVLANPINRVIIFSQWNTMLQLMGQYLQSNNINYVTSQGHTHQITCSINRFKTENTTKVLLLSSESANSGSNITEANHIFLLDVVDGTPEEARAVESQAIGRAVRLGQKQIVQVYRFIVKNTIEEFN